VWNFRHIVAFLGGSGLLEGGFWCLKVGTLYCDDLVTLDYVFLNRYAAPLRPDVL